MPPTAIVEERVTFSAGGPALSGILAYPEAGRPVRAVLLCSPHPHFAGDMENNIVRALAQGLAADSVTLRFDYRGVGQSGIRLAPGVSPLDYWDEVEERQDYADAVADVEAAGRELARVAPGLPMAVAGYSFGAVAGLMYGLRSDGVGRLVGVSPPLKKVRFEFLADCRKPCLMLAGKNDFVYSPEAAARLREVAPPPVHLEVLESSDHFFRGEETVVVARVRAFLEKP